MGRYLMHWSINDSLVPVNPRERASAWEILMELVKQDHKKGLLTDWGAFPGESSGYCIMEGSNLDVMKMTQQYAPYVGFEVRPVASVEEVEALLKHMSA
jgi:hypothetical protein